MLEILIPYFSFQLWLFNADTAVITNVESWLLIKLAFILSGTKVFINVTCTFLFYFKEQINFTRHFELHVAK